MADPAARPKRRDHIRSSAIDGEIVLYDPVAGQAAYLNQTAAIVWQLCDGALSVGEMIALLRREMGSPEATIARDVHDTVDRFVGAGLVG